MPSWAAFLGMDTLIAMHVKAGSFCPIRMPFAAAASYLGRSEGRGVQLIEDPLSLPWMRQLLMRWHVGDDQNTVLTWCKQC
ncbi:hypothetical protein VTN77DRAFT_8454 [Rasamsonia byssochlamydoides]|uniref:uncharacterized protein n=1 Tax=Rasamsonia byssochlamydoides TaxID=89139 RepID=UPI003741EDDC